MTTVGDVIRLVDVVTGSAATLTPAGGAWEVREGASRTSWTPTTRLAPWARRRSPCTCTAAGSSCGTADAWPAAAQALTGPHAPGARAGRVMAPRAPGTFTASTRTRRHPIRRPLTAVEQVVHLVLGELTHLVHGPHDADPGPLACCHQDRRARSAGLSTGGVDDVFFYAKGPWQLTASVGSLPGLDFVSASPAAPATMAAPATGTATGHLVNVTVQDLC